MSWSDGSIAVNNGSARVYDESEIELRLDEHTLCANSGSVFLSRRELLDMLEMLDHYREEHGRTTEMQRDALKQCVRDLMGRVFFECDEMKQAKMVLELCEKED